MTDRVEISKRMRVTPAHLEIKTRNGWKKVWWKKAKTIRTNNTSLDLSGKISLGFLCVVLIWVILK